jgi:hypothetical protein
MLQRIGSGRAAPPDLISVVGTKQTCRTNLTTSVDEGRTEIGGSRSNRRE